jgi:hypothetical protein
VTGINIAGRAVVQGIGVPYNAVNILLEWFE